MALPKEQADKLFGFLERAKEAGFTDEQAYFMYNEFIVYLSLTTQPQ